MSFRETELGLIPSEWRFDTLKDSVYIKGRIGWKGLKKSEYLDYSDFRIINGSNIDNNKIDWNCCGYISESRYLESPEIMLRKNDIVMTKDGTIGKLAIINNLPSSATVASGLFIIRIENSSIDTNYLYYYLSSPYFGNLINSRIEGSVIPHLYQKDLVELKLPLPIIEEQKAISYILTTIDEKNEVNIRINKILESMAQEIFKRWFVDFEFPNEDGEPYKSSGGEMVESEFGLIPKGWNVVNSETLFDVRDGTHDSPQSRSVGYSLITSKHLGENSIDFESVNLISREDYDKVNRRSKVNRFDILISMIGTVGKTYLVQDEIIEFAIKNIGLFKTSENLNYYEFFYIYLKSDIIQQHINSRLAGSTQKYISLTELRKIPVINSDKETLDSFKKVCNPIFTSIHNYANESKRLKKVRDLLLPKLMSGEIRVPLEEF